MAVRNRPRWETRNQHMTQCFQHRVVALPHSDGCITPSFTKTPIAGHMPHAHGIKRGIHHLTPPLRRRPCSEARWRSAIDTVGRHAINT